MLMSKSVNRVNIALSAGGERQRDGWRVRVGWVREEGRGCSGGGREGGYRKEKGMEGGREGLKLSDKEIIKESL